jgi:hypothetical protein
MQPETQTYPTGAAPQNGYYPPQGGDARYGAAPVAQHGEQYPVQQQMPQQVPQQMAAPQEQYVQQPAYVQQQAPVQYQQQQTPVLYQQQQQMPQEMPPHPFQHGIRSTIS